nr:retropepsin-like aspartic protease [uncultured Porphyromonas sp.]
MKQLTITLLALLLSICSLSAQEAAAVPSKDSIVAAYLTSGRYLDAMAPHRDLEGELHPAVECLYQALTHRALGRKQASRRSFQDLIEQYADVCSDDLIDSSLVEIANLSLLAGDSSGLRWLQRTLSAYAQAPEDACPLSRARITQLKLMAQERLAALAQPRMHLVHQPPRDTLRLQQLYGVPTVPIMINGIRAQAIVDTGGGGCLFLNEGRARRLGLQVELKPGTLNSVTVPVGETKIDSIRVGAATIYNVPVFVSGAAPLDTLRLPGHEQVLDSVRHIAQGFYDMPVLGLKLLQVYGALTMDLERNQLILRSREATQERSELPPNMYENQHKLYVQGLLNGVRSTLMLDTGLDGSVVLSERFALQHPSQLPLPPLQQLRQLDLNLHQAKRLETRLLEGASFQILPDAPRLIKPGLTLLIDQSSIHQQHSGDGVVGMGGLRACGSRFTLDFVNMRLSFD